MISKTEQKILLTIAKGKFNTDVLGNKYHAFNSDLIRAGFNEKGTGGFYKNIEKRGLVSIHTRDDIIKLFAHAAKSSFDQAKAALVEQYPAMAYHNTRIIQLTSLGLDFSKMLMKVGD